jgi:hypothetical protein
MRILLSGGAFRAKRAGIIAAAGYLDAHGRDTGFNPGLDSNGT